VHAATRYDVQVDFVRADEFSWKIHGLLQKRNQCEL
jgi:hypothetical protein